jgi:transposase-like protein
MCVCCSRQSCCLTAGDAGGALRRIGEQLGINPETLRNWVIQAEGAHRLVAAAPEVEVAGHPDAVGVGCPRRDEVPVTVPFGVS